MIQTRLDIQTFIYMSNMAKAVRRNGKHAQGTICYTVSPLHTTETFVEMAERLLVSKGAAIEKVRVDLDPARRAEMVERTGRRTVPQIYIGETHVGGYDDLAALDQAGKLDELLRT